MRRTSIRRLSVSEVGEEAQGADLASLTTCHDPTNIVTSTLDCEKRMGTLRLIGELWAFMRERKKLWLLPLLILLVAAGALLTLAQGSALAPFIYTIF
jgi:hypothetical protein